MEKDIKEIMQYYDRFIEIVKQISMDAEDQIIKLRGTAIADEIATDFSEIAMIYAEELLAYEWINKEHFLIAKSIDESLEIMSQKKELWNEYAIRNSVEWDECRKKGRKLLSILE